MKSSLLAAALLLSFALAGCRSSSHTVEPVVWAMEPAGDPADYEAAYIDAAAPGEYHAELAKGVGEWDVTCSIFAGPGTEPFPMNGKARAHMALGGRYLVQEFRGDMLGQLFEGVLYMGYDNVVREYFAVWMDNMSTAPSIARGDEDMEGAIDLRGSMHDPMTPAGRPFRHVSRSFGKDRALVQLFDTLPDGAEFVQMEMLYRRTK